LEELLLRHAVGLSINEWRRERSASGVMMIPVPTSGILEMVEGEQAARSTSGVTELYITARLHDYVTAWPEGSSYLGFLFAKADNAGQVEDVLRLAHSKLRFTWSPRLAVQHPATERIVQ
jgi:hypothetical protein